MVDSHPHDGHYGVPHTPRNPTKEKRPRSLLSLCLTVIGRHLEDLLPDMNAIAHVLSPSNKSTLLAIGHRRGLLNDELLSELADESWEILDVSGTDITDLGVQTVAQMCPLLKVVDISRCSILTSQAFRALIDHCSTINTLRCGGTALSNEAAKKSLKYLVPNLNQDTEAAESWEDLDVSEMGKGAQALRWLVWPSIDNGSLEYLSLEFPRVVVNPKPSTTSIKNSFVPQYALPNIVLDDIFVEEIDSQIWATKASARTLSSSLSNGFSGLTIAERFKLAFAERDERLAPKRAKNVRQNRRRAEKASINSDASKKALLWANIAHKSLKRSS